MQKIFFGIISCIFFYSCSSCSTIPVESPTQSVEKTSEVEEQSSKPSSKSAPSSKPSSESAPSENKSPPNSEVNKIIKEILCREGRLSSDECE